MTTACPRAHREKKNNGKKQQTDPRGEDRKEKQHKLRMKYTKCINSFETQTNSMQSAILLTEYCRLL